MTTTFNTNSLCHRSAWRDARGINAASAIAAWDAGDYCAALSLVGKTADALSVNNLGDVSLTGKSFPEFGGHGDAVTWRATFGTSAATEELRQHILKSLKDGHTA